MNHSNIAAISLFLVLVFPGTLAQIKITSKKLVNLNEAENKYFLHARKLIQGINLEHQKVDPTFIELSGFYSISHHRDLSFGLLYSKTYVPDETNGETHLQRWMAIQNDQPENVYYVPLITKIIYTIDSKEIIVAYRRTAGSLFNILHAVKDHTASIDSSLLQFLSPNSSRREIYSYMLQIMDRIQELGWHDCAINPRTFHYKPFGAQFDSQGNVTTKDNSNPNYYFIYAGMDSLRPVGSGCPKAVSDAFSAPFADSGWLKNDIESSELGNVTVFSMGVYIFTVEAYFLSALLESDNQNPSYKKLAWFSRNKSLNPASEFETYCQVFYQYEVGTIFRRDPVFHSHLDQLGGARQDGLLYKAFTVPKPIKQAPVRYIMSTILSFLSYFNSHSGEPFLLSEIFSALTYLGGVFQKATLTQHPDWATTFIKTEDNLNLVGHYRLSENDRVFWDIIEKMMRELPTHRLSFAQAAEAILENNWHYNELQNLFNAQKSIQNGGVTDFRRRLLLI
ncbi:MAG: hypothetical protein AAFO91_05880 [Bacteroidota bacterium]